MKRFILMTAVFVAAGIISQSACATARTVREDRVWEYSASGTYYDSNSGYLHLLKLTEAQSRPTARLTTVWY